MEFILRSVPVLFLGVSASAQTALLRVGDPAPSGAPGQSVTAINHTAVNQSTGFAASIEVSDGTTALSQFWGNFSGGSSSVLRSETTFGNIKQNDFDDEFGLSSASIAYSGRSDELPWFLYRMSLWVDDTLIGIEGSYSSALSTIFSSCSKAGLTETGDLYYLGGGGLGGGRGVFYGMPPTAVVQAGELLPNLPIPLSTAAVSFGPGFSFSSHGTHNIVHVDLEGSPEEDGAMSIDGAGLRLGGSVVREGDFVPTSVGGLNGEVWDDFGYVGITESGKYMFTGDTNATSGIIVRNGSIWARAGDLLGGAVLAGSVKDAFLNENDQLAFIWPVEHPGTTREALFVDDVLLLKEGDPVDWDGDGSLDPTTALKSFSGDSSLTMGPNRTVYFTADVDVSGTVIKGLFVISGDPVGSNYCSVNVNSTGAAARIFSTGSASLAANDLVLHTTGMPTHSFAIYIVSPNQTFVANPGGSAGNLCLGSPVGRGQAFNTGSTGAASMGVDWMSLPQPSGAVAAVVGDTWNFQCWMRDSDPMGQPTSNFSSGYSVLVR